MKLEIEIAYEIGDGVFVEDYDGVIKVGKVVGYKYQTKLTEKYGLYERLLYVVKTGANTPIQARENRLTPICGE